jgi:hypothetical protein
MHRRSRLLVALTAATLLAGGCGGVIEGDWDDDELGDSFWDETRDDDAEADGERFTMSANKRVTIWPGETKNAELVKQLPVGRSESGATRRVVLRLRPADLPKLAHGDRLITPAEVQVTTRCDVGQNAPGCNYNPNVRAQLIITGKADDTAPAGGGSKGIATRTLTCTKAEHHCKLVFRPSDATFVLEGGFALPCVASNSCYVNLVMWAWHSKARSGGQDKVLVGENEGNYLANGKVGSDKARLMIVRERGIVASDRARRDTSGSGTVSMNLNANPVRIYSLRLKKAGRDLKVGEQFLVEAKVFTVVNSRARFSTKMFLTKNPKATDGNGVNGLFPGEINEHNGINCTTGTSPCTTRKVAVFRVNKPVSGPVYVNIIAKSAVPGGGTASVKVKRDKGWLRLVRYAAGLGQ